jgi:hypothetical protein
LIRSDDEAGTMSEAQHPLTEAAARQFILTTVWQGLSELADQINAQTNRIATVTVDPQAELGRVSLCVYPVGSQPAQATPLFRYQVAGTPVGSGVRVQFVARPVVINGRLQRQEQGQLAMPGTRAGSPVTPQDVRDDVARRYKAVLAAQTAPDGTG